MESQWNPVYRACSSESSPELSKSFKFLWKRTKWAPVPVCRAGTNIRRGITVMLAVLSLTKKINLKHCVDKVGLRLMGVCT